PASSRRRRISENRLGTPWFTTSPYIARSCWPIFALISGPSFGVDFADNSTSVPASNCDALRLFIFRPGSACRSSCDLTNNYNVAAIARLRSRGTFFEMGRWPSLELGTWGAAMTKSPVAAQPLPYLRRYARALTGNQTSGDAYVAATLEALVKEPELLEAEEPPRVALFRLFSAIWNSLAVNEPADPVAEHL